MSSPTKRYYYNWIIAKRLDFKYILLYALIWINFMLLLYNLRINNSKDCVVIINSNDNLKDMIKSPDNKNIQIEDKNIESVQVIESNNKLEESNEKSEKVWWTTEVRGKYSVIRNYITREDESVVNNSVTLTSQATYEFLHHSVPLCQRWDGHLSIAVYAPGDDLQSAITIIYFLRECADPCVKRNISWHLVYDRTHGPPLKSIQEPANYMGARNIDCSVESGQSFVSNFEATNYRQKHRLPYPINVLRNVARLAARTNWVLPSDIELYPSANIVSRFINMVNQSPSTNNSVPRVYILPNFEVEADVEPPLHKPELIDLFKSGKAVYFHKFLCDYCHRIPKREKWMKSVVPENELNVFHTMKKGKNRRFWEPFYIGTNDEPLWDERLTWEGKRDKILQIHELCVKNYDFAILDNAFLVHAPGIKRNETESESDRLRKPYVLKNNRVYWRKVLATKKKTKNIC